MESFLDLLFKEDEGSGEVHVNKDFKLFESIRKIIKRDSGKNGEKIIARKEISYIYFTVKKDAFNGYQGEERITKIKTRVGLPIKWEADELVLEAIKDLKEDSTTTQEKLLASARRNLEDYLTLFDEWYEFNRNLITILKDTKEESITDTISKVAERKEAMESAKSQFKEMTSSIAELKKTFDLVDELELATKTAKKKEGRKTVSVLETDHDRYKRK